MATTNYIDQQTVIEAAWLNDVDYLMYTVFATFSSDGAVGADGTILVSDGTTYVEESGATARTSLGLGTADNVQFANTTVVNLTATGAVDFSGASSVDVGTLTSVDINGGNIDGTVIGAASPAAATVTNLTVNGNTILGDAATDTVTVTADVASNLLPSADDTYDIGAVGSEWRDLYIDGTANIDTLTADAATVGGATVNWHWVEFEIYEPTTTVATGTDLATFTLPFDGTFVQSDTDLYRLAAVVDTAGVTGTTIVDIHLNGTTIMTTNKLNIETTETSTATAATQPDLTTTTFSAGDKLTVDVDQVQTGTAPLGLRVVMGLARTSDG